jgi:PIN domain nuclease of toxin-antitoxin system
LEAKKEIENPGNTLFISIASLWEMAIKISLKKLELAIPLKKLVELLNENSIGILPINTEHLLKVVCLEFHHRDPFDRLIICQSIVEEMVIVSVDKKFDSYRIRRLW